MELPDSRISDFSVHSAGIPATAPSSARPMYIATEVLKGGADTPRSDIYSLGVTLYLLLTGQPPFEGTTLSELLKAQMLGVAFPAAAHVPTLSQPTREIVRRAMKRDPAERYEDCRALGNDIPRRTTGAGTGTTGAGTCGSRSAGRAPATSADSCGGHRGGSGGSLPCSCAAGFSRARTDGTHSAAAHRAPFLPNPALRSMSCPTP